MTRPDESLERETLRPVPESPQEPRLLDRVRAEIRVRHYSLRTEEAYVDWIKRFIRFSGRKHPKGMGRPEVEAFLTFLAVERHVSAPTQSQAKSALLFLYKSVLGMELPWLGDINQAKASRRLPVVLSSGEVRRLLDRMTGVTELITRLLFGTGVRLMEGLRIRVKDLDFERREVIVRAGKGNKDRVTMLPGCLEAGLREHLVRVRELHDRDLGEGFWQFLE